MNETFLPLFSDPQIIRGYGTHWARVQVAGDAEPESSDDLISRPPSRDEPDAAFLFVGNAVVCHSSTVLAESILSIFTSRTVLRALPE